MSFLINELFSVRGKTAIVTGGSRGIGRMIAGGYVQMESKHTLPLENQERGNDWATLRAGGCIAIPADLSTKDDGKLYKTGGRKAK